MIADEISTLFDNPHRLWMQVYRSMTPASQTFFVAAAVLEMPGDLSDLEASISATNPEYQPQIQLAERELDDTFLAFGRRGRQEVEFADFVNPSMQDFAYRVIEQNPEMLRPYLSDALFFSQLFTISTLARSASHGAGHDFPRIRDWARRNATPISLAMLRLGREVSDLQKTLDFIEAFCPLERFSALTERLHATFGNLERLRVWQIGQLVLNDKRRRVIDAHIGRSYLEPTIKWAARNINTPDEVDQVFALQELYSEEPLGENIETLRANFLQLASARAGQLGDGDETEWALRNELDELYRIADLLDCNISHIVADFENFIEELPPEGDDYDEDAARDGALESDIEVTEAREAVEIENIFSRLADME